MVGFDFAKNFATPEEVEKPYECKIKGEIPSWLSVTLLRNGPGQFKFGETECKHWFDGMSFIQKFEFKNQKMFFSAKFLKSLAYQKSLAADRLVASQFGTARFPDPCKNIFDRYFTYLFKDREFSDNALVNFFSIGDAVFATTERPYVTQIDVNTLETVNRENLSKYVAVHSCTAHQHSDENGNIINIGARYGKSSSLAFVKTEISESSKKLEKSTLLGEIMFDSGLYPPYVHSFAFTPNYLIVFESPLKLNLMKILAMKAFRVSLQESISWYDNTPTKVHVFNWKTGEPVKLNYVADPQFTFHHANSFEIDGKYIVLDYCKYDRMDLSKLQLESMRKGVDPQEQSEPYLHRMIIPLITKDLGTENLLKSLPIDMVGNCSAIATDKKQETIELKDDRLCAIGFEFPRYNYDLNGKDYLYVYGAVGPINQKDKGLTGLIKLNVKDKSTSTWQMDNTEQYCTEPVFVSRPGSTDEDDGVILSAVLTFKENEKSFLLVLDAKSFKELARCYIEHRIPITFHGLAVNNL